jgi:hypothetical protein
MTAVWRFGNSTSTSNVDGPLHAFNIDYCFCETVRGPVHAVILRRVWLLYRSREDTFLSHTNTILYLCAVWYEDRLHYHITSMFAAIWTSTSFSYFPILLCNLSIALLSYCPCVRCNLMCSIVWSHFILSRSHFQGVHVGYFSSFLQSVSLSPSFAETFAASIIIYCYYWCGGTEFLGICSSP